MTVGTVAMRYESDVRIPSSASFLQLQESDKKEWVSRCPAGVFDYEETSGQVRVVAPEKCIFCMECQSMDCLLYTSDAADEEDSVDLGGGRIVKKKKKKKVHDRRKREENKE
eukprot:TRINITY_DN24608_c0_g1_i1.p1 TRINITY_DN24608_c0_g1~~TRINITY_DN24608_c0_g1_i1.p1  ORF type:complete len:112 (-),score=15.38 TRINITY_DN24608_c0_g1_i1:1-336(-)